MQEIEPIFKNNQTKNEEKPKISEWKYKNFKFPSPLPDNHNNVIIFNIKKN